MAHDPVNVEETPALVPPPKDSEMEECPANSADLSQIAADSASIVTFGVAESSPVPEASGSLFKCSICGDLVYESQLSHHVQACPDPGRSEHAPNADVAAKTRACQEADVPIDQWGAPPGGSARRRSGSDCERDQGIQRSARATPGTASVSSSPLRGARARSAGSLCGQRGGMHVRRTQSGDLRASARPQHAPVSVEEEASEGHSTPEQVAPLRCEAQQARPTNVQKRSSWRQFKDSNIERHHAEAEERARRRKQQLQQELSQREDKECTFAPQLVARRQSTGTRQRPNAGGCMDTERVRQQQQLERQRKMERVEAEIYGEVTHRPQISPFARAWSARDKESCGNGIDREGTRLSVFDRLYRIASQAQAAALPNTPRSVGDAGSEGSVGAGSGGTRSGGGSRKLNASQLLYTDAIDRRHRQRSLEEQASELESAERRSACQVLGRSRRYYWQMLERQIKDAFNNATGGGDCLEYPALEDFLRHFGVLRAPKATTPLAKERAAEESRRLRVALWKHLDPSKVGHVDFLTLTVFFHVLMGAVDEEAQCLHNLSAIPPQDSCTGADCEKPSIAAAAVAAAAAASGGSPRSVVIPGSAEAPTNRALEAIFEEAGHTGESSLQSETSRLAEQEAMVMCHGSVKSPAGMTVFSMDAATAAAAAAAAADPEGRRICELLMRFDPKQLRTEFQQLYLDRMHNGTSPAPPPMTEETRAPELNAQSRALAERVVQRQRDDVGAHGGVVTSHTDLLYWRYAQAEAKKEELRVQRRIEEEKDLTFHPSVSSRRRAMSAERQPGMLYDRLYAESTVRQENLKAKAAEVEHHRSSVETAACTFKPDLKKSGRSYIKQHSAGGTRYPTPRGYDECKQRLRKAFVGQVQRRKFLEDRFMAVSPSANSAAEDVRPLSARSSVGVHGGAEIPKSSRRHSSPTPMHMVDDRPPLQPVQRQAHTMSQFTPIEALPGANPLSEHHGDAAPVSPRKVSLEKLSSPAAHALRSRGNTPRTAWQASGCDAREQGIPNRMRSNSCEGIARGAAARSAAKTGNHMMRGGAPAAHAPSVKGQFQAAADSCNPLLKQENFTQPAQLASATRAEKVINNGVPPSTGSGVQPDAPPQEPVVPPPNSSAALPSAVSPAAILPHPPPIVYVEVNIAPGQPPQRLELHEGQSAAEAAAEFAAKHKLHPQLADRLHTMLRELLDHPERLPVS